MKIVFLSHTAGGGDFVVGSHHLSAALAARGHEVQHLSAPVTPLHLAKLGDRFVRRRFMRFLRGGERLRGVEDLVPFSPVPWALARRHPWLARAHSRAMLNSPWQRADSLALNMADRLIVDEPRLFGIAIHRSRHATLAYRATDLYAAMRGDPHILDAERVLCRHADVLVATSEPIAAHLRNLSGRQAQVIGNGVESGFFSTPATSPATDHLPGCRATRAIYVGACDARLSAEAIAAAANALPERWFLLAGPGSERVAAALSLANVRALGAVPYATLPVLLQSCAVGLLPFSGASANAGRSPMKLFEYAAAGLSIAATADSSAAAMPTLCVARTREEFATTAARAFELATDANLLAAGRERARAEDWHAKATQLMALLQPVRAEVPRAAATEAPPAMIPARDTWS